MNAILLALYVADKAIKSVVLLGLASAGYGIAALFHLLPWW